MKRLSVLLAAVAASALLASAGPRPGEAQTTYIPRVPEVDTLLYKPEVKDPRVAPRDAWNPVSMDPHVPKNENRAYANNDYFSVPGDPWQIHFLEVVENGHLGSKKNPRGFWNCYNRGQLDLAILELKYVLCIYPNHPRALLLLTMVAKAKSEPGIPIAFFEKAIHMFPTRAVTHSQYGTYLVDIGETTQAILELEKAVQLDPNNYLAIASLDKARTLSGIRVDANSPAAPSQPASQDYAPRR